MSVSKLYASQGFPLSSFLVLSSEETLSSSLRVCSNSDLVSKVKDFAEAVLQVKLCVDLSEEFNLSELTDVLASCPNLKVLDLTSYQIGNATAEKICDLIRGSGVEKLIFHYNHSLGNEGLQFFADLPNVKILDFQKCPSINEKGRDALLEKNPRVEVLVGGFLGYEE